MEYEITLTCRTCGCPIEHKTTEVSGQMVGLTCSSCRASYTFQWDYSNVSFDYDVDRLRPTPHTQTRAELIAIMGRVIKAGPPLNDDEITCSLCGGWSFTHKADCAWAEMETVVDANRQPA